MFITKRILRELLELKMMIKTHLIKEQGALDKLTLDHAQLRKDIAAIQKELEKGE